MKRKIWLGIAILLFILNAGAAIVLLVKFAQARPAPVSATSPTTQSVQSTRP